jgi:hypothetical protein
VDHWTPYTRNFHETTQIQKLEDSLFEKLTTWQTRFKK